MPHKVKKTKLKRLLYVSSCFGEIQNNLYKGFKKQNVDIKGIRYSFRRAVAEAPEYCIDINLGRHFVRGPVLYLHSIHKVAQNSIDLIKNDHYDAQIGHMLFSDGVICNEIYKRKAVPYVVCVRNTDMNLWFYWKIPWIRERGLKAAYNAKRIIFINKPYSDVFLSRIPLKYRDNIKKKIEIIPNGIDNFWHNNRMEQKKRTPKGRLCLISVGRLEKNKNQIIIPEVMKRLEEKGISSEYVNVGEIKDKIIEKNLKQHKNVSLIERKTGFELLEWYRKGDIFLLPSLTETFGLVYAEAMTQGLPILYTRGQGFDGQFEEGEVGFSVCATDASEIAEKIIRVLDDYENISSRCLCNSVGYTWRGITQKYENTFDESWL